MIHNKSVYLGKALNCLPGLLGMINDNPASWDYGLMDRLHWGWKLIDYANAVPQGVAHGLARLIAADLLPDWLSREAAKQRVLQLTHGLCSLTRADGSVDNAYPRERSFAATGFVLYDFASAWSLLRPMLDQREEEMIREALAPLVDFLHKADETHGVISNHLAGTAAGLYQWHSLTGNGGKDRADLLLGRVLDHQNVEGWYLEYDGPDPGYQTLCTTFLSQIHALAPELGLKKSLKRSLEFLTYCAHPDGTYGGLYGARNTRFVYPGGIQALAQQFPEAQSLALFFEQSLCSNRIVPLEGIDLPNLANAFNSYCLAAQAWKDVSSKPELHETAGQLHCHADRTFIKSFPDAGLLFDKGKSHYTIVNWKKGGVVYHFKDAKLDILDAGVLIRDEKGKLASTQTWEEQVAAPEISSAGSDEVCITVEATFYKTSNTSPSPFQFFVLRLLCFTVLRSYWLNAIFKKILVRMLIRSKRRVGGGNSRTITLGRNLFIQDSVSLPKGWALHKGSNGSFVAIHMASQGYWQSSDDSEPFVQQRSTINIL